MLQLVIPRLGKQPKDVSVWIEHEDSSYGTSIAREQEQLLKAVGAKVSMGAHSARSIDLPDSILRVKNTNPDSGSPLDTSSTITCCCELRESKASSRPR